MRQTQRRVNPKFEAPREPSIYRCEADVVEGLEQVAYDEIAALGTRVQLDEGAGQVRPGVVRFLYTGNLHGLLRLQTVVAVYVVRAFPVPRPKALLSNEFFLPLLDLIGQVRAIHPPGAFQNIEISAAGSDSPVMMRIKQEIATRTGMAVSYDRGDILLRIRHATDGSTGWEVLVRVSPRPLATRPWRVCNLEGALNATIAHAMARLSRPEPRDVFLNMACGSGTLLVERLRAAPAHRVIGCDIDPTALACAQENAVASGYGNLIELHPWDARELPLPDASIDALSADLPFGHLVGSHAHNLELYPAILREAARVARSGATFTLITHEIRLAEGLLADSEAWETERVLRVRQGGLHPRIFVLRRR